MLRYVFYLEAMCLYIPVRYCQSLKTRLAFLWLISRIETFFCPDWILAHLFYCDFFLKEKNVLKRFNRTKRGSHWLSIYFIQTPYFCTYQLISCQILPSIGRQKPDFSMVLKFTWCMHFHFLPTISIIERSRRFLYPWSRTKREETENVEQITILSAILNI